MTRITTLVLAALVSTSALALDSTSVSSAGFDKLTEAQKAEVLKTVATQAEANKGEGPTSAKKVSEWIDVGTHIGQGLGSAAKELGVVANDFVKTPVGKWTMAIIVWKFMGGPIIHVFAGVLMLLCGMAFLIYMQRRSSGVTIEYGEPRMVFGVPFGRTVKSYQRRAMTEDDAFAWVVSYAVLAVASMAVIFTY